MFEIRSKLWIEKDERKILGRGPVKLLEEVDAQGSLRQAALSMGMSYTKAWHMVAALETAYGVPMLSKRIGGASGGSSTLTPEARELIRRYRQMEAEAEQYLDALYRRCFEDL